jgi:hypothetical protein
MTTLRESVTRDSWGPFSPVKEDHTFSINSIGPSIEIDRLTEQVKDLQKQVQTLTSQLFDAASKNKREQAGYA